MNRKQLLQNLERLNINKAIADSNATVGELPAILLRWNGEYYYTGFGAGLGDPPEIEDNLVARFADQNLDPTSPTGGSKGDQIMRIEISNDAGYWGEPPTQADLAELERIVLAIEPNADIEIVAGDDHNGDEAQMVLDRAWQIFCNS